MEARAPTVDYATSLASGERSTRRVVALAAAAMVLEVVAGWAYNSMALQAEGWHMGTHAAALGITLAAYAVERRTRKRLDGSAVNAFGGLCSATVLGLIAGAVLIESAGRLGTPVVINFSHAVPVSMLGLGVNLACVGMLHGPRHQGGAGGPHHDHNLEGAYLHVLSDALLGVLTVVALVVGGVAGWTWLDAVMGIVGAVVIAVWAARLLRRSARRIAEVRAPG